MKVIEAKIVVLGSQGVGKTSMVVRYIGKMFSKHISPTIGASFFTCKINLEDATVKLQVWDTAGQERFRSMAPMYYRNANAALLVFDITSTMSFNSIKSWVKELQSNVTEPMVLALVGNKCDLADSRQVSESDASQYAASIGASYCETSALHDQGIDQVFVSTASALLRLSSSSQSLRTYRTHCRPGIDQVFVSTASALLRLSSSSQSLRAYETDSDALPAGTPTEEDATHTGKVELPAWSIDSVAHGEMQRSMCC